MNKEGYKSIFQKEIRDLIELKRALGFSYESEAGSLRRIDTFLCENNHYHTNKSVLSIKYGKYP